MTGAKRSGAPSNARRRIGRVLIYWFPLLLCTIFLFRYGAGERGRYEASLFLVQRLIHFLTPDTPYKPNEGGLIVEWSMYQLNDAFRRVAHIGLYALLTFLIVRAIQQGRTRLKFASIAAAIVGSGVYVAADEITRLHELHRHAKPEDVLLNAIGVGIILVGTLLFFATKSIERRLADDPTPMASPPQS